MTITIITNRMIIYCGINMYKSKLLYQYKNNNLTYRVYDDNFSTTNSVASKLNIYNYNNNNNMLPYYLKYGACFSVQRILFSRTVTD